MSYSKVNKVGALLSFTNDKGSLFIHQIDTKGKKPKYVLSWASPDISFRNSSEWNPEGSLYSTVMRHFKKMLKLLTEDPTIDLSKHVLNDR